MPNSASSWPNSSTRGEMRASNVVSIRRHTRSETPNTSAPMATMPVSCTNGSPCRRDAHGKRSPLSSAHVCGNCTDLVVDSSGAPESSCRACIRRAEEVAWRTRAAQELLPGLATYDEAIRHSIGLRVQERLTQEQARFVAECQSVHRDVSLHYSSVNSRSIVSSFRRAGAVEDTLEVLSGWRAGNDRSAMAAPRHPHPRSEPCARKAALMFYTGRRIKGAEAVEMGLADALAPLDEVRGAGAWAGRRDRDLRTARSNRDAGNVARGARRQDRPGD